MAKMNFISRCGIYCGACFIYCASRDGGKFLDYISKQTETPKEQIKCAGCLDAWVLKESFGRIVKNVESELA